MVGTPPPDAFMYDDAVAVALLLTFVGGMVYWRKRYRWVVALLFCVQGALLALLAARAFRLAYPVTPTWQLLTAYFGVLAVYLILKQMLYHWVNQIFFSKAQNALWRRSYASLLSLETGGIFPLLLLFTYLHIDAKIVAICLAVLLLFVKFWLLLKGFSLFFAKNHGFLAVFVYFCTLEGTPFVVLCASLIEITRSLITL